MQSESLAHRNVLRGAVGIIIADGPPRELPRLYARWIDSGHGEIMLRACHTDSRESLTTHGIGFGETLVPGQTIELHPGQMELTLRDLPSLPLVAGSIRVLDTDGWTYIRFASAATFANAQSTVDALLDGWYVDVTY